MGRDDSRYNLLGTTNQFQARGTHTLSNVFVGLFKKNPLVKVNPRIIYSWKRKTMH